MAAPTRRDFTRLAIAIVLAGVVISAGIFASSYRGTATTVTQISTTTRTFTVTTSVFRANSTSITANSISISTVGSETFVSFDTTLAGCCNKTEGAALDYPISISYGGSWILHYWVQNFSGPLNTIEGNLNGSGSSSIWITFNVAGVAQYTLCASATTLPDDSSQYSPLRLSLFYQNENTTVSNPTVEVCGTMAV